MRGLLLVILTLVSASHGQARADTLLDFAEEAWKRQPETRIADAYKWLFHATQGGEHAIVSVDGPRSWLDGEWKTLGKPLEGEPLMVSLRPDGRLIRLNLRPFKAAGGKKGDVLHAFVTSAKQFRADPVAFRAVWDQLGARLKKRPIGKITANAWSRFDAEMRRQGFPACEHSPEFEKAYRPAYRVLLRSVWDARRQRR